MTSSTAETTAITILGVGAMGSRLATRLTGANHDVTVWNRTPDAARELAAAVPVTLAETARAAVADADVVLSMVTDDGASRSLWLDPDAGALAAMRPGAVAVEASTITRSMAIELADAATASGISFLEAPVVGSRPQAEAGVLLVLVGGDRAALDRVEPIIAAYAAGVRHLGPVGAAATMKLVVNGLFGVQVAAYAEMIGVLERSSVDTAAAVGILGELPITSPGLHRILGLIAARDFAPNFPVALVAKDFDYLRTLATDLDADTPVALAAGSVYAAGAQGGQATLDIAGIADRYLDAGITQPAAVT